MTGLDERVAIALSSAAHQRCDRSDLVRFIHRYPHQPKLLDRPSIRSQVGTYLRHPVLTIAELEKREQLKIQTMKWH